MNTRRNSAPGDNPGFVYLALRDDGLYKIGRSYDPPERIKFLQYYSGWRSELIWKLACADQVTTERALHMRFGSQHAGREWFVLSAIDVAWLIEQTEQTICEGYSGDFARLDGRRWR